jgi:hypothetical protein
MTFKGITSDDCFMEMLMPLMACMKKTRRFSRLFLESKAVASPGTNGTSLKFTYLQYTPSNQGVRLLRVLMCARPWLRYGVGVYENMGGGRLVVNRERR